MRTSVSLPVVITTFFMTYFFAGCFSTDRNKTPEDASPTDTATERNRKEAGAPDSNCTTDNDCETGYSCIDQRCKISSSGTPPSDSSVQGRQCQSDQDCDISEFCHDGDCEKDTTLLTPDATTPATLDAATPMTLDATADVITCAISQDCEQDMICHEGECRVVLSPSYEGNEPRLEDTICIEHSDCFRVARNCCACSLSVDEYIAMTSEAATLFLSECGEPLCSCLDVRTNPFIRAACIEGYCRVVDVSQLPEVSGCSGPSDCHLRLESCCECEQDPLTAELVAVSSLEAYENLICWGTENCGTCEPVVYPSEVTAFCDRGLCKVADPR